MRSDRPESPARSGRWTVSAIVAVVLLGWFGLDRAFRAWTARYQARAHFGASVVAPSVDSLAQLSPLDCSSSDWQAAVADTHAMLVALTGAGLLDQSQMETLHHHLTAQVAQARTDPTTARATLARIWDDLQRDAGPVIAPDRTPPPPNSRHAARHPRPARPPILGPARPPLR